MECDEAEQNIQPAQPESLGDAIANHFDHTCREQAASGGEDRRLKRRTSDEAAGQEEHAAPDWIQEAMKDSLRVFGSHVERRIGTLENRVADTESATRMLDNKIDKTVETMESRLYDLRHDLQQNQKLLDNRHEHVVARHMEVQQSLQSSASKHKEQENTIAKMQDRIAQLEHTLNNTGKGCVAASSRQEVPPQEWLEDKKGDATPSGKGRGHTERPQQSNEYKAPPQTTTTHSDIDPRVSRMGNLGWDTEGSVLLDRATHIISDIGMSEKVIEMRAAVSKRGTGSCVDIMWTNTADIQEARFKVRCKNVVWTGR